MPSPASGETLTADYGALPPLNHDLVPTPWYDSAVPDIKLAVLDTAIAAVWGPAGVGKTSTVISVLRDQPRLSVRYVNLQFKAGVREGVSSIHQALGMRAPRSASVRTMGNEIVDILAGGGIGIVADEIHHVGESCMLTISQLWERVRARNGRGFPFFLVGASAPSAIRANDELFTRIAYPIHIDTLTTADVLRVVRVLSPRCAATSEARLTRFDDKLGHGLLRTWELFLRQVERFPEQHGQSISDQEFSDYIHKHTPIRTARRR